MSAYISNAVWPKGRLRECCPVSPSNYPHRTQQQTHKKRTVKANNAQSPQSLRQRHVKSSQCVRSDSHFSSFNVSYTNIFNYTLGMACRHFLSLSGFEFGEREEEKELEGFKRAVTPEHNTRQGAAKIGRLWFPCRGPFWCFLVFVWVQCANMICIVFFSSSFFFFV